jgi:hypothetical protein
MALDETTHSILSRYLADIRQLPNESAKTHRFSALISELFPGSSAPTEFAAGIEKLVRIDTQTGTKRGFVDALADMTAASARAQPYFRAASTSSPFETLPWTLFRREARSSTS